MGKANANLVGADELVRQLIANPEFFAKKGKANELLKYFFDGYPIEHLRLLLQDGNPTVVSAAIWIASELPWEASTLLSNVIDILGHPNRRVRFYALDVTLFGAVGARADEFYRVVRAINDPDDVVVDHAIFLLSRAAQDQIVAAMSRLEQEGMPSPLLAALGLLANADSVDPVDVERLLEVT